MYDEIYQEAFNDELEKIALSVQNRVITRGKRHYEELSNPVSTSLKKEKSILSGTKSESREGFKLRYRTRGASRALRGGIF